MERLAEYDFDIVYAAGKSNKAADALSRRPDHRINDTTAQTKTRIHDEQLSVLTQVTLSNDIREDIRRAYTGDAACVELMKFTSTNQYEVKADGLLYHRDGRIRIPDDVSIKSMLLYEAHDGDVSGHTGINKTAELLARQFDWPHLRRDVEKYVSTCIACQANKSSNQRPIGLLQPLPIPKRRWQVVTMDLITGLPMTRHGQHDAIVVFVDKLSKMVHYAPCTTTVDAPTLAKIFLREVVRLHGVPEIIISDRDPRFTSHFWTALWNALGTKLKMSTAYHPQTDGQTENANRTLENMLRAYVNYHQDDWDERLSAAEIAVNNSHHSSTGFTPYYMNSGQHPHLPLTNIADGSNVPAVQALLRDISNNILRAEQRLLAAQQSQSHHANKKRRHVVFNVGDQVWLSTSNLNIGDRARELSPKYTGPFVVEQVKSPVTYKLKLPPSLSRIHNVFHSSQLKPYYADDGQYIARPRISRPPPDIIAGEEEWWEVERIVVGRST
jgi:hypothetical protein